MARLVRSEDLDRLLNLVERNRANDAHEDGSPLLAVQSNGPVWSSNHDFWVEQLKEETASSWSEQQYTDAANLINLAEYQRVALSDFANIVASNDTSGIADSDMDWDQISPDPSDAFAAGADQIRLRDDFSTPAEPDDSNSPQSGGTFFINAADPEKNSKASAEENLNSGRADLTALGAIRSRETGTSQFNQIRADLYVQTGLASLRPYASWDDFQSRNSLSDELVSDLQTAYPDGFDAVDMWVAGLAEISTVGIEGSTVQAAISDELDRLHKASDDMGLDHLLGTGFDSQLSTLTFTDIVERHTQSSHINADLVVDAVVADTTASLDARSKNLVIQGTEDADVLAGGDGNDIIFGGAGDDVIFGGIGNDELKGGKGNDKLVGGIGTDNLDGGEDADIMFGGAGDDTIYIDNQDDQAVEAANEGTDTVKVTINVYVLPENVEILVYIGDSSFIGTGNELVNIIVGGDGSDTLRGEGGDDIISGGYGDDILDGGDGADVLIGGLGSDVILVRDAGDIVIESAGGGTDTVITTLSSYALTDNIEILMHVGEGSFTAIGNALSNFISGSGDADYLSGRGGNDTLDGGAGDDSLDGGEGDDTLDGGEGDDCVTGGQGNDYVMFTRGSDTLVLRQGFGNDIVIGFDPNSRGFSGSDRIDVSSYGYTADSLGVDILLIYDGESTTVRIGSDSVKLVLVDINTMDRHDFIFS